MIIDMSFLTPDVFLAMMAAVPIVFGISFSTGSSKPKTDMYPGAMGWVGNAPGEDKWGWDLSTHSRRVATDLEALLGASPALPGQYSPAPFNPTGADQSAYSNPLMQALLNPSFGPTSSSETALLNSIMNLTAGRGAVRGLGAPTQASLAQSVAPTLVDMRQKGIENLMSAFGMDVNRILGERGQTLESTLKGREQDIGAGVTQRGQDLQSMLGLREQDIGGLLNLITLLMPQLVGGQQSKQFGIGIGVGGAGGGVGGGEGMSGGGSSSPPPMPA